MSIKKNNASTTLAGDLLASGNNFVVNTGEGALFPTTAEAPYKLKIEQYSGTVCIKREVLTISARTGDAFTISARASETCVQDDSQDPKTRTATALSFSSGDTVKLTLTEEDWNGLEEEVYTNIPADLALKVDKTTYNAEKNLFTSSSTWTDAYQITDSYNTDYVDGKTYKVVADVANTGAATLQVNALAAKNLQKVVWWFNDLVTGDIVINQIFWATYNANEDVFQFSVDPAGAVSIPDASETEKGIVERATNTEAEAWTDTTRFISPYHAKTYYWKVAIWSQVSKSNNVQYTAATDGFVTWHTYWSYKNYFWYRNGTLVAQNNGYDSSGRCGVCFPVSAGDTYKGYWTGSSTVVYFSPLS